MAKGSRCWKKGAVLSILAAAAICWAGPTAAPPRARPARPDILLISIDCLNQRQLAEALRAGGLPGFKGLARDSLQFRRAYSHAPWTTPAHSSLLTGLYPSQHGRDLPWGLMLSRGEVREANEDFPTLPELLTEAGYETVAFVGQGSMSPRFGLGRGFRFYRLTSKSASNSDLEGAGDAFLRWLSKRRAKARPFFVFLHTFDLHEPRPDGARSEEAAFRHLDAWLSRVLEGLRESAAYDRTLVVLTGDHGSAMLVPEDRCCAHGAGHYQENINIPLLLKLPAPDHGGGGPKRGMVSSLARHVDILPTVLDVAGIPAEGYTGPGVSLLADAGKQGSQRRYSFSEADGRCVRRFALVGPRYKYILTPRDEAQRALRRQPLFVDRACPEACRELPPPEELFDLLRDPREEVDLLRGEISRPVREALLRLRREMAVHRRLEPRFRRDPETGEASMDAELEASLRALGYL